MRAVPRQSGWATAGSLALLCAALAGCATSGASPGPLIASSAAGPPQAERDRVAAEQTDAAHRAAASGRGQEALWRWRVVEAVSRDAAPAQAEIAALQARLSLEASAAAARGAAQRRAHDEAGSTASDIAALQLDPRQPGALEALRQVEATAVLRGVSQEQSTATHRTARRRSHAAPR